VVFPFPLSITSKSACQAFTFGGVALVLQQFALGAHAQLRMIFFHQLGAFLFQRPSGFLP
jgi:hypothetical protein